jgi:prepilin-type N-terminal cleavage/methylation domain-containing protein
VNKLAPGLRSEIASMIARLNGGVFPQGARGTPRQDGSRATARLVRAYQREDRGEGTSLLPARTLWKDTPGQAGFTLLETMIAMAIMMIAFGSILMVQSSSLRTSMKSKQINVVAALARNKMVESELEWEGKPFSEIQKEKSGEFPAPYQDYKWKREIAEVKFPAFNLGTSAGGGEGEDGGGAGTAGAGDLLTRMGRIVTAYFSKAVREVKITITWKRGAGEQSYTIATYWIDLEAEFSLNE